MTEEEFEEICKANNAAYEKDQKEWMERFNSLPKSEQDRLKSIAADENFAARMTGPVL